MLPGKPIHYLKIICLLCCATFIFGFKPGKHKRASAYWLTQTPPNGVKIANNLFYDQTEISNTSYREYLYWTAKVFGVQSPEYIFAMPDTMVWMHISSDTRKDSCAYYYSLFYLRHPAYQDYPVVGVSQKQALAYTKWRADRVMEFVLVKNKVITWDPDPTKDNYFSIERYFTGEYKGMKPDTNYMYYPDYSLPTITEWKEALHYTDSTNTKHHQNFQPYSSNFDPCKNIPTLDAQTRPVTDYVSLKHKHPEIFDLRGNVSEWTSEPDVCVGGGWHDTKEAIMTQDTFQLKTDNAWTGFRNACRWKKWTSNQAKIHPHPVKMQ